MLRAIARNNPSLSPLYLVFSRSMKESEAKAHAKEHTGARVETIDALAFGYTGKHTANNTMSSQHLQLKSKHVNFESKEVAQCVAATLEAFTKSADSSLNDKHVPIHLPTMDSGFRATVSDILRLAKAIWDTIISCECADMHMPWSVPMKLFELLYASEVRVCQN